MKKSPELQVKRNNKVIHTIRNAYLVRFVDPEKHYPVSYTITHKGKKIYGPDKLQGKDLTQNQIVQLFIQELL